jgi:ADP-heptose:LPS heptosyltransferase
MDRLQKLKLLYFRVGLHTAPPGTLLDRANRLAFAVALSGRMRALRRRLIAEQRGEFFSAAGTHVHYDIERARAARRVDGLALVFFMGLGDYLMATPLLPALRATYPELPLYAYASTSLDQVNSPLVAAQLEANPCIARTLRYQGRHVTDRGRVASFWKNYDYSAALQDVPEHFLMLPVLYDLDPIVPHRVTSLFDTFGLPPPWPVPVPLVPRQDLSARAQAVLDKIRAEARAFQASGIVCCHFDVRSSGYVYPNAAGMVRGLLDQGRFVIGFSRLDVAAAGYIGIDINEISVSDSIEILRALAADPMPLHIISVNSVLWAISAALGIRNLGLHTFYDESIHQYVYANTFVVSQHLYPRIPATRLLLAPKGSYRETANPAGGSLTSYDPAFVLDCFRRVLGAP